MQTSPEIDKMVTDFLASQVELKNLVPDKSNPHFKSGYVSLAKLLELARDVLNKHGIFLTQDCRNNGGGPEVETVFMHKSGQWMKFGPLLMPLDKQTSQGVGSAETYGRRYALAAALGIAADEDDDGNTAEEYPKTTQTTYTPPDGDKEMKHREELKGLITSLAEARGMTTAEVLGDMSEFPGKDGKPVRATHLDQMSAKWIESTRKRAKDEVAKLATEGIDRANDEVTG